MNRLPLLLAGISDDFTGGLELAAMMARDGLRTRMLTLRAKPADLADLDVAVVALKSRVAPAGQAVRDFAKAANLIAHRGARQIFFKYCATFDSTPRGNIGPCADYLADRLGAQMVGFSPAFPDVRRYVYQGHLFVGDQLVSESPKRFDPLTPMRDPNLVRVLQSQTPHKVGVLRRDDLIGGQYGLDARISELQRNGIRYAICDATSNDDLARLAALTVGWPLMTGGSSVAEHYPALWRAQGLAGPPKPPITLPVVGGRTVILAGSCAEQTAAQLAHFGKSHPLLTIDILQFAANEVSFADIMRDVRDALAKGSIAVAVSATPDAVLAAQRRFGRRGAGRRAEKLLGDIAKELHGDGIRRFVVAGGETSGAILEALRVRSLDISPYLGPGTARAVTAGKDPISFHLKPGKLGAIDMFDRIAAGEGDQA